MEREQFKTSTIALIRNSNLEELIEKVMDSGAIDIENQDENDFATRKALACAVLQRASEAWQPLSEVGKKELSNILKFI